MTNPTSTDRVRGDCRLIAQTLNKLSTPRILLRLVVIVAAIIIWLWVSSLLLNFGRGLTYTSFASMGQQVIDMLTMINPYLWWVVVVLWTLIVFFSVRGWFNAHVDSGKAAPVHADDFRTLCARLSPEVRDVMNWSWANRDEPFTVGDLRRTLAEVRHGRIDKLAIVREQEAILAQSATEISHTPATRAPATVSEPVLARSPERDAPVARAPAEPAFASERRRVEPVSGTTAPAVRAEPKVGRDTPVRVTGETRTGDAPRRPVEPRLTDD